MRARKGDECLIRACPWDHLATVPNEKLDLSMRRQLAELFGLLAEGENLGMPVSRPMSAVGHGVHELRVKDRSGQY